MPRVHHVKSARKNNSAVNAGEPYYWWSFYRGGRFVSATYPRRSALTQSRWSDVFSCEEQIGDLDAQVSCFDDAQAFIDSIKSLADGINEVAQEYQESADNIESGGGCVFDACTEKAEFLENLATDIEFACDSSDFVHYDEPKEPKADDFKDDAEGLAEALAKYATELETYTEALEGLDVVLDDLRSEVIDLDWESPC